MRLLPLLIFLPAVGCAAKPAESSSALREAELVLDDYRQAWLAQDSVRVMSHVSDQFVMMTPSSTVSGKERVRSFWFPGGDTVYPIQKYDVSNQMVYGEGEYVIAEGTSLLTWDTTVRDSVIASATSKSEYINVLRKEEGKWRLYRAIFVVR